MQMMRTLSLCLVLLSTCALRAQDRNYDECVVKASSEWGRPCEKCENYTEGYKRDFSGTYQVTLRNNCTETVELKVAMQELNGTWRTFPVKTIAANGTMTAFACQGTGKYLYWVRRLNDVEIILPSDREILADFKTR
jgi:hypothetical protein